MKRTCGFLLAALAALCVGCGQPCRMAHAAEVLERPALDFPHRMHGPELDDDAALLWSASIDSNNEILFWRAVESSMIAVGAVVAFFVLRSLLRAWWRGRRGRKAQVAVCVALAVVALVGAWRVRGAAADVVAYQYRPRRVRGSR